MKHLEFYVETYEKYYWLGFFFADAGITSKYYISIGLALKDKIQLEKLKKFTKVETKIEVFIKKYDSCRLCLYGKDLVKYLEQYGIIKQKSKYGIPKNIPNNFFSVWLLGLFDGDGSIFQTKRGDYIFSLVGNYETMLFVQKKIKELYNLEINISKNKSIYQLRLGELDSYCILARLYKENKQLGLPRKYNKFLELKNKVENRYKSLIDLYKIN